MKKKLLAISVVVIIAITAIASASLAYLTDNASQTNTFTSGNVDIKLDEAKVVLDNDGYISETLEERTEDDQDYGKLFPGQVITKDPTITNVGSEKAYVAAKIVVTASGLESLIGTGYEGLLGINELISGGLVKENDTMKQDHPLFGTLPVYGDDTYSIYQVKEADGVHVFRRRHAPACIHAHSQRRVLVVGKAPVRGIQLEGGHAQIQQTAVQ